MRWREILLIALTSLVLISCGKNKPVAPPVVAPNQAPPPPNYNYTGGGNNGGNFFPQQPMGNFRPQMPQGQQPQYYPFVPLDNFMRRDPQLQQYWGGYWQQWQRYAQQNRISPYDFSTFWFDYCPQQWGNTQFADMYNYMDSNFYYWTQPGIQFHTGGSLTPEYFWQNANGFPMPQYRWYGF